MKWSSLAFLASPLAAALELPRSDGFTTQEYESGQAHEALMNAKHATWSRQRATGRMDSSQYPALAEPVVYVDGLAVVEPGNSTQTFQCKNNNAPQTLLSRRMDLLEFKSHADLGSCTGGGSSSWGWVSDDGREFAAIGQADGTAFSEISPDGQLIYLGRLPQQSQFSIWREIRSYKNYVIIGSEAIGHGVQIFDWTKLLALDPASPVNFSTTADLTGLFTDLPTGRTHNVVVNEELDYAVAVGARPRTSSCAAGLIYIDLKDRAHPTSPGCAGQDGYVHDAQCLVYHGPDARYEGREICYGLNEDTLTIFDVTNKAVLNASSIISKTSYVGARYTHQEWVLDADWQAHLLIDDELDEDHKQTGTYKSSAYSVDHNQYVFDGLSYQSNYGAGIRVLDVSSIPHDPTGGSIEEVAYFDIYPEDDHLPNGGIVDFVGTWSHYAGYPSGNILVNTIERGAFVVKMQQFDKRGRDKHYQKPRNV